jgi:hypothetical protein
MKNLITQNSKLKETSKFLNLKVYNFGITAYKTSKNEIVCPMAKDCVKFCYAKKGAYIWSNVAKVFEQRYEATKKENFIDLMTDEIKKKKVDFLRVHDSGDYYNFEYLLKWFKIAALNKNVGFYSYTNSISMVKKAERKNLIPENFDFIFSDSGKQKNLIDKNKDRHTKIFKNNIDLFKNNFIDASKIDLFATKFFNPENNKVGLIFH